MHHIIFWDDIIYFDKFDNKMLKINKRENRESNNIYYISYVTKKPEYNINSVNTLYLTVKNFYCTIEKLMVPKIDI